MSARRVLVVVQLLALALVVIGVVVVWVMGLVGSLYAHA